MIREKLMKEALDFSRNGAKLKGNFYKFLSAELDRRDHLIPEDEAFEAIIKRTKKSLEMNRDDQSKRELEYLEIFLPKMIDHEFEYNKYLEIYTPRNKGDVAKYFNKHFKGKCDMKVLMNLFNK